MNKNENHEKRHYWLYVLKLEDDKYYVGTTKDKDPQTRINQHKNGFYTAQWVRKYPYIETVEIIELGEITKEEAEHYELERTLQYMKKYGLQSTRGAKLSYRGKYVKLGTYYIGVDDFHILAVVAFLAMLVLLLYFEII